MFDFMGDRADEVITLAPGVMRVWGYRGANATARERVDQRSICGTRW